MSELLVVKNLKKYFPRGKKFLKAVDNVSFTLGEGQILGLVGESGSGKSTLGRSILRLIEPDSGEIHFRGVDLRKLGREELRRMRRDMQIIFQDPLASLNPQMSIGEAIADPLHIHNIGKKENRREKVLEMLDIVGIGRKFIDSFPFEFSGGQQQRVGLARALISNPKFIICDEPVSALDVSIQAQIIALLLELREKFGLSYLFISHDLSVVRFISDFVAVLYLGRIVEMGPKEEIFANPLHPYTRAMIMTAPRIPRDGNPKKKYDVLQGEIPSPVDLPQGCRFKTRCPMYSSICDSYDPEFIEHRDGHWAACHKIVAEQKVMATAVR